MSSKELRALSRCENTHGIGDLFFTISVFFHSSVAQKMKLGFLLWTDRRDLLDSSSGSFYR